MTFYPPVPPPTPAVIKILAALVPEVGRRVATDLSSQLPALRIANVGQQEGVSDWEEAPMFQVEVWDTDSVVAERLAYDIKNAWPSAVKQTIGPAVVHGRWVVQNPIPLPPSDDDAKDTDLARYMLTVGLRLTGVPTHG